MASKNKRSNKWTRTKKNNLKSVEVACWLIVCPLGNAILAGTWRTSTNQYPSGLTVKRQQWNNRKRVFAILCSLAIPQGYSLPKRYRTRDCSTTVALAEKSYILSWLNLSLFCWFLKLFLVYRKLVSDPENSFSTSISFVGAIPQPCPLPAVLGSEVIPELGLAGRSYSTTSQFNSFPQGRFSAAVVEANAWFQLQAL